jgi:aerobic carbon-monoxide dehydrogenase medium subunit
MKPPIFDYFSPASVEEALTLLGEHGEGAKLLAGGQSLMPALNFRLAAPAVLIDLNPIGALGGVHVASDGRLVAGAMTRHRCFETSTLIQQRLPLVQHAMASVAHVAIRNRGTIGGSLCHADPAAEWPALCLACDAEMVLQSGTGLRRVKAGDFSRGLFTTALGGAEILVQVIFPAWPETRRWGFQELARRRGDFAIVGVACVLDVNAGGICTDARIVVFGATDIPVLLHEAAAELTGRSPTDNDVRRAARAARGAIDCRSDHHASAAYRSELVQALTARAVTQALTQGDPLRHG